MLSGNRALLERNFRVRAEGTQDGWQPHLAPVDATLAQQVHEVRLYGRGADLILYGECAGQGDVQRMLLAGVAQAATEAGNAATLAALCQWPSHVSVGRGMGAACRWGACGIGKRWGVFFCQFLHV